jgi:hypothetical protein
MNIFLLKKEVAAFRSLRVRMERFCNALEPAPVRPSRTGLSIPLCQRLVPPSRPAGNPRERGIPPRPLTARPSPTFFFSEQSQ